MATSFAARKTCQGRAVRSAGIKDAYIESFNGKFRDECLNEHWLTSLAEARAC